MMVESGAMRFLGSVTPGVFVRGEHAMFYARLLESVAKRLRVLPNDLELTQLENFAKLLREADDLAQSDYMVAEMVAEKASEWRKNLPVKAA